MRIFNPNEKRVLSKSESKYKHLIDIVLEKYTTMSVDELFFRYSEPWRVYHTFEHIVNLLSNFSYKYDEQNNPFYFNSKEDEILFLAILFHDIVYDPKMPDGNELNSASLFLDKWKARLYKSEQTDENLKIRNDVYQAILTTMTHEVSLPGSAPIGNPSLCQKLIDLDLGILRSNMKDFIEYENKIFKEFQFVDYETYKTKRIEVLKQLYGKIGVPHSEKYVSYVETRQPKIGVFAGSFNPFHKGHLNILQKAERIFDKVIIAYGINTEKGASVSAVDRAVPEGLKYHQVDKYFGLLTSYLSTKKYPITLIRGLRNSSDVQYENNLVQYLRDLGFNDLNVVYMFCDKEFEHISSSTIRSLPGDIQRNWVVE